MGTTSETKPKRYISVGLLAHVDSGKTTLSEGILYLTGQIRKPGRVDHGDAFLDNYALERQRGITIFSKQAVFQLGDSQVTLLDTPGHVDFSAGNGADAPGAGLCGFGSQRSCGRAGTHPHALESACALPDSDIHICQ